MVPRDVSSGGAVSGGRVAGGGGVVVTGGGGGGGRGTAVVSGGGATVAGTVAATGAGAASVVTVGRAAVVTGAPSAGAGAMLSGAAVVAVVAVVTVVTVSNDGTGTASAGSVDLVGSMAGPGRSSTVVAVTTVVVPSGICDGSAVVPRVVAATGTADGAGADVSSLLGVSSAWAIKPTPANVADTLTPVAITFDARERRLIRRNPRRR